MPKKLLSVVRSSTQDGPPVPPRQLGVHGMKMWSETHAEYAIADRGGIELLALACAALDRAEDCAETINREGASIRLKSGTVKDHPLLRHELSNRCFVARCISKLGLDVEVVKAPGRPADAFGRR